MSGQKNYDMPILSDKTEMKLAAELASLLETIKYGVRSAYEEAKSKEQAKTGDPE